MKPRFVYVHGNDSTSWQSPWAVWLKQKLDSRGYNTWFETMPDPKIAHSDIWLPYLQDTAKVGPNDVIVGWSSGAVAAMRYAETHKILGSILLSPCYTDLGDDVERQSGYYDKPWQWAAIKANQKKIALVFGDDDPYISQSEFAYIAVHLGPTKLKIPGVGHFQTRQDFPELLRYIEAAYPLSAT
jgi:predicted alpha/beta hydrolase family esterase